MLFKCKLDIGDMASMKTYGNFGYCKYLAKLFGFIDSEGFYQYRLIEEDGKKNDLEEYLDSILGKELFKDKQKELIEKIDLRDARSRQQKSIEQFNAYFEANKMPYIIINKRGSERINDKIKSYRCWEILRSIN